MTLVSHHGAPAPTYTKESYMGCEHAQAAGGQTSPSQIEENTLSEVKRAIATELARHGH